MRHRYKSHLLRILRCLHLAVLLIGLINNVALAQAAEKSTGIAQLPPAVDSSNDIRTAIPVAFPAMISPKATVAPALPLAAPLPTPAPVLRMPAPPQTDKATLMISRMSGEVHFKHLGGPRLEPSRALQIGTGGAQSWCEFKMNACTGRVWKDSDVTVLPDASTIILKKGSIIVNVKAESGKYSVIAGDLLCRTDATTLRVQRTDRNISFQVLDGTVTVCNRATGEVYTATQVVQPVKN